MPALHAGPALTAVKYIMAGLTIPGGAQTAFGEVGIGRRLSASKALVASILLIPNDIREPTQGIYQWDFTIAIEMFYRVGQNAETAEIQLGDAYAAAIDAFYNNRTLADPNTGQATVRSAQVKGPSSNPEYEPLAGSEYRVHVLFLNCWNRTTFNVNQP